MTTPQPTASRPAMQNYGISESSDGLMSWEWANVHLTKARNYWIATARPDGKPHVAPIWGIWHEGALYFGSDANSRKARNFRANPNAVVHLESGDDVVILEGRIDQLHDEAIFKRVGELYLKKYDTDLDELIQPDEGAAMWRFVPVTGMTWLESDFPNTATRWTFPAR